MTRNYPTTCICGHEEEDHRYGYGECLVEGCLCTGYEPEEDEQLYPDDEDEDAEMSNLTNAQVIAIDNARQAAANLETTIWRYVIGKARPVDLARSVEQAYRDVGELGKIVPDLPDTPYNNRSDAH